MSRIILSKYDDGEERVVVGWDRPLQTYYWQIFSPMPPAEESGEIDWDKHEDWEEMIAYKGYNPGELPLIDILVESAPDDVKSLLTADVMWILRTHRWLAYPDSNIVVDLADGKEV